MQRQGGSGMHKSLEVGFGNSNPLKSNRLGRKVSANQFHAVSSNGNKIESEICLPNLERIELKELKALPAKTIGLFENRSKRRVKEQELQEIPAQLLIAESALGLSCTIVDYSHGGFGIFVSPLVAPRIEFGMQVVLQISLRQKNMSVPCTVVHCAPGAEGMRFGLARSKWEGLSLSEKDRRRANRLTLKNYQRLYSRAPHALFRGTWDYFTVLDVNKNMGLALETHNPESFVMAGMEINLYLSLPGFTEFPYRGIVTWVWPEEGRFLRFGLRCLEMSYELNQALCDYLLDYQDWTPNELRRFGFQVREFKSHLKFRCVESKEEYLQVVKLRWLAYVAAGKQSAESAPEGMASSLDSISRIIVAYHHGMLAGSLTATFPQTETDKLETEKSFPNGCFPCPMPAKTNMIEVARLCTHFNYRGGDLLRGLFEQAALYFLLSGRESVVTSAVDNLMPLYQKIGFKDLGHSYAHPTMNSLSHHLVLAHRNSFLWGQGISWMTWCTVFGDMVAYLLERGFISPNPAVQLLIKVKLTLMPLLKRWGEHRAKRSFRYHLLLLQRGSRKVSL